MTIIQPDGYTLYEAGGLTVGLTGPDYVTAVTDGSDDTWVQLRQSGGLTSLAFVKWTLPAIVCSSPGAVSVKARIRWDDTTLLGRPSAIPTGSVRLTYSGDGVALLQKPWPVSMTANEIVDFSAVIDTTSGPVIEQNYADWLVALGAGDAELWTTLSFQSSVSNRLDIIEAWVDLSCGTPPLRQNQRDDIRQGQRTSRQLTVRQVGYL